MKPGINSRGPDSSGKLALPNVGLLNTRLAVIDVPSGDQPMGNEDDSVICVYNGEIYNYRQLRSELIAKGHRFRSRSDTEVLVHLYEDRGLAMLSYLSGMFAFALYDSRASRLIVARDPLGMKPLFVGSVSGGLAFASSIDSLLAAGSSRDPDAVALAQYLVYHKVPEPRTAYAHIQALPPGYYLEVHVASGAAESSPYYVRPQRGIRGGNDGSAEALKGFARRRLEAAVRSHLVADVPLGVFLSGGVDSSLVAAEAQRLLGGTLRTFSVGFGGRPEYDETSHAERVASILGTEHRSLMLSSPPTDAIAKVLDAAQQPFAIASFIPLLELCEFARGHVKVVLTGDGGDEVSFGYPWYRWARYARPAPPGLGSRTAGAIFGSLERAAAISKRLRLVRRAAKYARGAALGGAAGSDAWRYDTRPSEASRWLKSEWRAEAQSHIVPSPFETVWDPGLSSVEALNQADVDVLLRDEMLPKLDRAGMAHGLEGRVPLLDQSFREAMWRIPASDHLTDMVGKTVLREWVGELVPGFDGSRQKHGFEVPMLDWLTGPMYPDLDRLLLRGRTAFVAQSAALSTWQRAQRGVPGASHTVYAMLILEAWSDRL